VLTSLHRVGFSALAQPYRRLRAAEGRGVALPRPPKRSARWIVPLPWFALRRTADTGVSLSIQPSLLSSVIDSAIDAAIHHFRCQVTATGASAIRASAIQGSAASLRQPAPCSNGRHLKFPNRHPLTANRWHQRQPIHSALNAVLHSVTPSALCHRFSHRCSHPSFRVLGDGHQGIGHSGVGSQPSAAGSRLQRPSSEISLPLTANR
jgi:hypothetical protein